MKHPVLIIGAGAAGLFAALGAQKAGCLVLEKMSRPGIKLALTGNGRGNLTNASPVKKIQQAFFEHGDFLRPALLNLSPKKLRVFFSSLGLPTIEEEHNRVFPASRRAKDIVSCLQKALDKAQLPVFYEHRVTKLCLKKNKISGVECDVGGKKVFFPAKAVVLACGGMARPHTGSNGDGYALARSVAHTVTTCLPALTPLLVRAEQVQTLQGISLAEVKITLFVEEHPVTCERGAILFTHFGLSGPAILDLSRFVTTALAKKQKVKVELDLFADIPFHQLDYNLTQRITLHGKKQIHSLLSGILPARLARFCLVQAGIDPTIQAARLAATSRKKLVNGVKNMSFSVTTTGDFRRAMLTRGGIRLDEVNQKSLESRLVKGLFFAGEILDLDGKSGGYNLQAAFSTGLLAGKNAAETMG